MYISYMIYLLGVGPLCLAPERGSRLLRTVLMIIIITIIIIQMNTLVMIILTIITYMTNEY